MHFESHANASHAKFRTSPSMSRILTLNPAVSLAINAPSSPLPLMVPRRMPRRLHQRPCILNRHGILAPNPDLLHRLPEQPALRPRARALQVPQLLTRAGHALVHAHHLPLLLLRLLPPEQHPRPVDDPMPQVSLASHPQGGRELRGRVQELHQARDLRVEFGRGLGPAFACQRARRGSVELLYGGLAAALGWLLGG